MPPKSELRQLFKQQKQERQKEKRVEHPLAKYDSQGRLLCALCNLVIKTTALWPVHLTSNAHKENVARLKAVQQQRKRSAQTEPEIDEPFSKRAKFSAEQVEDEDDDMQDATSRLPSDFFDTNADAESTVEEETEEMLPAEHRETEEQPKEKEEAPEDTQNAIPQGFFDDPEEEARARKAVSSEQFEKELQNDMAQFQELMAETGNPQPSTQAQEDEQDKEEEEDDNIWSERDEELLRQQAEFDSRVEKLKQLRKQGVRPSDAMDTTNETRIRVEYDVTESRIRAGLKSGVRELLKKEASKNVATVFEDMDDDEDEEEEEEEENDEFGWRTQQV